MAREFKSLISDELYYEKALFEIIPQTAL